MGLPRSRAQLVLVPVGTPMMAAGPAGRGVISDDGAKAADAGEAADRMLSDPVYGELPALALARLLPHVRIRQYASGENVIVAGDAADFAFITLAGTIRLTTPGGSAALQGDGRFGDEAACLLPTYVTSARAEGPVRVAAIEHSGLAEALVGHPQTHARMEEYSSPG